MTNEKDYEYIMQTIATNTTCIRKSIKVAAKIGEILIAAIIVIPIIISIVIFLGNPFVGWLIVVIIGLVLAVRLIILLAGLEDTIDNDVAELSPEGEDESC